MRKFALFLFIFALLFAGYGRAQAQAIASIDNLQIEIWPDYDQQSALVLLTGFLASAPATVTLPLPADATLNVVARVTAENSMIDDITVDESVPGQITFTTPDPTFRVEYYLPYQREGSQRNFTFAWQADLAVDLMEVAVQQPTGSSLLVTDPTAETVGISNTDGFTYHVIGGTAVPAGEPYAVSISYDNPNDTLSVNAPPPAPSGNVLPDGSMAAPVTAVAPAGSFDWALVGWIVGGIGLVLVVAAITWQIASRQGSGRSSRPRKPQPQGNQPTRRPRPNKPQAERPSKATRFCTNCGNELTGSDKFCRECGTPAKNR